MRGHTLLEPIIIVAVGLLVFFGGRFFDAMVAKVVGGVIVAVGVLFSSYVAHVIDRQRRSR